MLPSSNDDIELRLIPEIVARASRGEQRAIQFVLPGFAKRIFQTVRRMRLRFDETEDACAEALSRAWLALPSLRDPTVVSLWLDRLAVHAGRRILRRRLAEIRGAVDLTSVPLKLTPMVKPEGAHEVELRADLESLLGRDAAALLWSVKCQGCSIRDIAEAERRPERSVRQDLRRAVELARTRGDRDRRQLFLQDR